MSYKILFKGQIPEEFVEDSRGERLAEDWQANRLVGKININDNVYDASSIKAVVKGFRNPDREQKNEEYMKEIVGIRRESEEYFASKQKLPPEVRSQDTGLAEVLYVASTGKQMPEEVKEQVRARQLAFFKEHDYFAEAKPTCYRDLIPVRAVKKGAATSIMDLLQINTLHFAERVVSNGIQKV